MFVGHYPAGSSFWSPVQITDGAGQPATPAAPPTWRAYTARGVLLASGTAQAQETGPINGAVALADLFVQNPADPALGLSQDPASDRQVLVTSALHRLLDTQRVTVSGVVTVPAANGTWNVRVADSSRFLLVGSNGQSAGSGPSFGSWMAAGLYAVGFPLGAVGPGAIVTVVVQAQVGAFQYAGTLSFQVV